MIRNKGSLAEALVAGEAAAKVAMAAAPAAWRWDSLGARAAAVATREATVVAAKVATPG